MSATVLPFPLKPPREPDQPDDLREMLLKSAELNIEIVEAGAAVEAATMALQCAEVWLRDAISRQQAVTQAIANTSDGAPLRERLP
jgi:hypothetical protein